VIVTTDLAALAARAKDGRQASVVSIGVFDGVHLGHGAILEANQRRAAALGAVSTVVTFQSHPKALLLGRAPRTLTTLEHRLALFQRMGIGHAVALPFDEALRDLSAQEFTRRVLIEGLSGCAFVLGFDSKFGRGRMGDADLLRGLGHAVEVVSKVLVDQRAVSSTAIREAVELGDLASAARMLGRGVAVYGEVVEGLRLGRELGFPTANLDLHHELHPPTGVYAGWARVAGPDARLEPGPAIAAVANIGFKPTIDGERPELPTMEVHLLDGDHSIYGQHLEFEFALRLRGEERFESLDALKVQIGKDVKRARAVLDSLPS
jgi:riboflavin kinase / FMN adenylyltransferase